MNPELAQVQTLLNQKVPNADKALKILKTKTRKGKGSWLEYHYMGVAELLLTNYDAAANYLIKAIDRGSDQAETLHSLSVVELHRGNYDESIRYARKALNLNADFFEAWMNLGDVYRALGDLDEALKCYMKANQLDPKNESIAYRIARIYDDQGDNNKAIELYDIALRINPDHLEAALHKGYALTRMRAFEEAENCFNTLSKKGREGELASFLGLAELFKLMGIYDRAIDTYEEAIAKYPALSALYVNYALCLQDIGEFDRSEAMYLKALEINPDQYESFSSYLMGLHYNPERSAEHIFQEHKKWDGLFAQKSMGRPVPSDLNPDKKIRLGLISGGFRRHPVGWMILSMMEYLSEDDFEIYCYSANNIIDSNTNKIYSLCDSWKSIKGFSDDVLSNMIREDEIDILIELSGHSEDSRLKVISMEPAPVTVKWVGGLFNTTGLKTMDYLLTDPIENPAGSEVYYTEKLLRMPEDYICYQAPDYLPDVEALPALKNGYITFGCFNNPTKINDQLLEEWAQLLHSVPESRLFLKSKQYGTSSFRERIAAKLELSGVERSRVLFEGESPHVELFEAYNKVDIALDPWPYSGGLTTIEALLMGVPVVTFPGPTFAGRHAASHIHHAGLSEFIASGWNQYVQIASELANDTKKLSLLRSSLRKQIQDSPVMDGKRFAAHFEDAMRALWNTYIKGAGYTGNPDWKEHIQIEARTDTADKKQRSRKESKLRDHVLITDNEIRISLPKSYHSLSTFVFSELGTWMDPEVAFLNEVIQSDWKVADVGAAFGAYTLTAASKTGQEGKVWAFEPVHSMREHLLKSIRLNGYTNTEVFSDALGAKKGKGKIRPNEVTEWSVLDADDGIPVRIISLDERFASAGTDTPDLIKVDVHGQELEVLKGASTILSENDMILIVSLEGSSDHQGIQDLLRSAGYRIYQYLPSFRLLHPCEIEDISGNKNLIAFKDGGKRAAELSPMIFRFDQHAQEEVRTDAWLRYLTGQEWIWPFIDTWKNMAKDNSDPTDKSYLRALNLAATAEWVLEKYDNAHQAASMLLTASSELTTLLHQHPDSLAVAFTLSRVLYRLDNRSDASYLLQNQMHKLLVEKQRVNTSKPFLLPLPEMENEHIKIADASNWLKVKSIEGWLLNKEWSSWFLNEQDRIFVKNLKGNHLAGSRVRGINHILHDAEKGILTPVPRQKKGTFIHIMFNHVYAKAFSDLAEYVNTTSDQDHRVFVNIHRAIPGYTADIDDNPYTQWFDSDKHLSVIIDKCSKPDVEGVFIHGLFFPWQETLINELTGKKHLTWVIWGGDLYTPVKQGAPLYDLVHKVDSVACTAGLDYFAKVYGEKQQFRFSYAYPGLYGDYLNDRKIPKKDQIIIGNSGDPSNDHEGILKILCGMKDIANYTLLIPVSYNLDPSYLSVLRKLTESYGISSQTEFLTQFIPPEQYYTLMLESRLFITAHHRQQSMGNILMSLHAGNITFFRKEIRTENGSEVNPSYPFLDDRGFIFNTFEELEKADSIGSFSIRNDSILHNRGLISEHFGMEARAAELVSIGKELINKKGNT